MATDADAHRGLESQSQARDVSLGIRDVRQDDFAGGGLAMAPCAASPSSGMQDFKHIEAWRRGHALSISIHKLARGFTRAGYPRLRSQLTGAADSISENIVEGC